MSPSRSFLPSKSVLSLTGPGLLLAGLVLVAQESKEHDPAAAEKAESAPLSGPRQLTLEGVRPGEGYFSADGRETVFQSEREEGNPFYQIYRLDLETGDTERVSPGK